MEIKTKRIIDDYIDNVNKACRDLLGGINRKDNQNLKTKWDFFEYRSKNRKMEFEVNNARYQLHGSGCFLFSDQLFLNWDFGYRSRWCGIDPWMIGMTLEQNKSNVVEYYNGEILKSACEQAVTSGVMFEKYGLYYYSIPAEETFIPHFPKEYDMIVIRYFDSSWKITRNKITDRFLRKSARIHNEIYNKEYTYSLGFYLDEQEIYTIPYDDTCYPENAIKIMSDNILRNLKKNTT